VNVGYFLYKYEFNQTAFDLPWLFFFAPHTRAHWLLSASRNQDAPFASPIRKTPVNDRLFRVKKSQILFSF